MKASRICRRPFYATLHIPALSVRKWLIGHGPTKTQSGKGGQATEFDSVPEHQATLRCAQASNGPAKAFPGIARSKSRDSRSNCLIMRTTTGLLR